MRSLAVALTCALVATAAHAQAPAASAPPGPSPTGLVVGSGNFFSPIVRDLDRAVAFYRDGLGLESQGAPGDADTNPALRNMFGLPDAQACAGRSRDRPACAAASRSSRSTGAAASRSSGGCRTSGAYTLIVLVRDIDSMLARLKQLGARRSSSDGGAPACSCRAARAQSRRVIVQDPDGHFVELVQPDPLPEAPATPRRT